MTLDFSPATVAGAVAALVLTLLGWALQRMIAGLDRRQAACDDRTEKLADELADVRERLARVEPRPR